MQVKIAGYNVDADLLQRLREAMKRLAIGMEPLDVALDLNLQEALQGDNLTPETIAAAYARISRYPESVGELRRSAARSVARARKSNRTIIFEYGHNSVAEHAVFNVDITGISRLGVETVEARRLMSYTEKSQRYIALNREYVIPPEFTGTPFKGKLEKLCEGAFDTYQLFLQKIEGQFGEEAKFAAREDARYILPLSCGAQLGMTGNARNIEHLLRRTLNHPLGELREFGKQLKEQAEKTAPSLIRHLEAEHFEKEDLPPVYAGKIPEAEVSLVNFEEDLDAYTLTAMIFAREGLSCGEAYPKAKNMPVEQRRTYFQARLKDLQPYHTLPRAFETAQFGFEIKLSATAFAQLKRHRLAQLLPLPYEPKLGVTMPQTIIDCGMEKEFHKQITAAEKLYSSIREKMPYQAPYALANAHRRVVYFQANARELGHFARMRMDKAAQWDIRRIAGMMISAAREKAPLTTGLVCGKDDFAECYKKFMD